MKLACSTIISARKSVETMPSLTIDLSFPSQTRRVKFLSGTCARCLETREQWEAQSLVAQQKREGGERRVISWHSSRFRDNGALRCHRVTRRRPVSWAQWRAEEFDEEQIDAAPWRISHERAGHLEYLPATDGWHCRYFSLCCKFSSCFPFFFLFFFGWSRFFVHSFY